MVESGRLAGIDYGTSRVGVAVSDADQTIASPYENYRRQNERADALYFQQLVRQQEIAGFVVGLPVHLSGEESQKSGEARRFGEWLGQITSLPVEYFDERFTSVQAEALLTAAGLSQQKRKQRRDKLAAQIMLAAYLEHRDRSSGNSEPSPGPIEDP